MIINPLNKIYIGQTINFIRRMNSYKNSQKLRHQLRLKESLVNYGFENHEIIILCNCNQNELNFWEEFYIKLFNTFEGDYGLNATTGGKSHIRMKGVPKSDEWKLKISKAHVGKKRAPFSKEWIENISKSHKGLIKTTEWLENLKQAARLRKENNGYVISESQKEKFRKSYSIYANSSIGIERRKQTSELAKKRFSKPVLQYSLEMGFIKKWDSAREAASNIGIKHPNLVNCTNFKAKSAGGYIWRKETNKNIEINKKIKAGYNDEQA
jgi:group I intron endonuclease